MARRNTAKPPGRPPTATDEGVRKRMRSTRRRDTGPEIAIRRALHARGLRYRLDLAVLDDKRRRVDVVFPRERVALFVDGCFWHSCPEHRTTPKANRAWWKAKLRANWQRDRRTDEDLRAREWTVIRSWEHEDPESVAARVRRVVLARRREKGPAMAHA
jgi:DNA mismatch endonuclease (patch repair protein)